MLATMSSRSSLTARKLPRHRPGRCGARPARCVLAGWTLVELLMAMGVGLFLCAVAGSLMVSQWQEHRHLLAETLLQQELRNAMALLRHEIHRSGADADAHELIPDRGTSPAAPGDASHLQVLLAGKPVSDDHPGDGLSLSYSRTEAGEVRRRIERGVRLQGTQLQYLLERSWQPWSDNNTVRFLKLELRLAKADSALPGACLCTGAREPCEPRLQAQILHVLLVGQSRMDNRTLRSLSSSIHVRNSRLDWPTEPC